MYITKGFWAGAACIVLVSAHGAAAADLPPKMVTKAPSVAPQYNWNGVYLGFNLGGSFGKQSFSQVTPAPGSITDPITAGSFPNGFIGGGQLGYNWQTYGWVLGLEADYQGSTEKDPQSLVTATTGLAGGYNDKITSFGTVRGRVGYAVGERGNGLPYLTGGWAYARGSISGTATTVATTAFSQSQSYNGWTAGAGFEWGILPNVSVKAEYLYIGYDGTPRVPMGGASGTLVGSTSRDNIMRVGFNFRL
jgi:outer membrane immunogenic protein